MAFNPVVKTLTISLALLTSVSATAFAATALNALPTLGTSGSTYPNPDTGLTPSWLWIQQRVGGVYRDFKINPFTLGSPFVGAVPPVTPFSYQLWWNIDVSPPALYYYSGSAWLPIVAGSSSGGGGGSGTGDVVGPSSSVAGHLAAFNGITGNLLEDSGKAFPTGVIVGTTDSQTLTNKTISGASNTLIVRLSADVNGNLPVTNLNSGTSASSSTFWRGDGTWAAPSGTLGSAGSSGDLQTSDGSGGFVALVPAAGISTWLATPTSANLGTALTTKTGTGNVVFSTSPTLVTPALGTPSSITLSNATGLPLPTGVTGDLAISHLNSGTGANTATFWRGDGTWATPPSAGTGSAPGGAADDIQTNDGVGGFGAITPGTGIATWLVTPSSANLAVAITNETGSGLLVFATSPTLVTPALGTPSAAVLTNATGLPLATGVTGDLAVSHLNSGTSASASTFWRGDGSWSVPPGTATPAGSTGDLQTNNGSGGFNALTPAAGIATWLTTPTSANLATALTDETGTGAAVFASSPTLVTPALGTPSAVVLTNATGLPLATGTTGNLAVSHLNSGTLASTSTFWRGDGTWATPPSSGGGGSAPGGATNDIQTNDGVGGFGAITPASGVATWLVTPSSINLAASITDETGSGSLVFANSPTLITPALGTPSAAVLTNATGLPLATGVTGNLAVSRLNSGTSASSTTFWRGDGSWSVPAGTVTSSGVSGAIQTSNGSGGFSSFVPGTGVSTFLTTPSSANLATATTDETGSGSLVFAISPTLVTPALGTPSAAVLTNATGLPLATGVTGNLAVARLGSGTGASSTTFWRGDGSWAVPAGSSAPAGSTNDLQTNNGSGGFGSLTPASGMATFLATPTSANLAATVTNETGSGLLVFATSPTLVTPALGTPSSVTLTNGTSLPLSAGTTGNLPAARLNSGTNASTRTFWRGDATWIGAETPIPAGWVSGVDPNEIVLFTAWSSYTIADIRGTVVSAVGAAATASIYKAPSGTACAAGMVQHSSSFNANGTANTNQTLTLAGGAANVLASGDRLCIVTTGGANWTGGAGNGAITVTLRSS